MIKKKMALTTGVIIAICVIVVAVVLYIEAYQRQQHHWLPSYLLSFLMFENPSQKSEMIEHVMFLVADHHEHPFAKEEARVSLKSWNTAFEEVVHGARDAYGNPFKYTWFYAYDHKNEEELIGLNELVCKGYGEVEFHWHHNHQDAAEFERQLKEALDWFGKFGIMKASEDTGSHFAFIHGNWALDNSGKVKHCGIDNEIEILQRNGGYVDYTFSSASVSQPPYFSKLMYVVDDPAPDSFEEGVEVAVNRPAPKDAFLIFQGPTTLDLKYRTFEHGQLETWWGSDWPHRAKLWIDNAPYVIGRPEWRFVKLYTHGVQSRDLILSETFTGLINTMIDETRSRNIKLHFVTAREAYNIVKATEAGLTGDPEKYRDYIIAPPMNTHCAQTP